MKCWILQVHRSQTPYLYFNPQFFVQFPANCFLFRLVGFHFAGGKTPEMIIPTANA